MPVLFHHPVDRRDFMRVTALGAAAMVSACRTAAPRAGDTDDSGFRVALFSDTHIPADPANGHRGFRPGDNLRAIVPEMVAARPQAAILCGDAARLEGKVEDYEALKLLLAPLAAAAPISIALGNHDDRANFRKAFAPGTGPAGKAVDRHLLVVEHPVVRLVILDSLLQPNQTPGLLGKAQREWLDAYLGQETDRPVVILVHHTLEDRDGDLLDADRLFGILGRHRQVKAVFYGHSHVWEIRRQDRLHLINLPAVGYNFADKDPLGWVDAQFRRDGVQLTLRALAGNRAEDGLMRFLRWA